MTPQQLKHLEDDPGGSLINDCRLRHLEQLLRKKAQGISINSP